jgi:hypothetical protein
MPELTIKKTEEECWEWYKETCLQNQAIYIIKNLNTSYYKIGISKNIHRRLRQLELQSGCILEIIDWYLLEKSNPRGAKDIEKILHNKYKKHHVVGEWFDLENDVDNLLNDFITLCDNY